jgi:hypothetical protein
MIVSIQIDCEDERELLLHISVIRQQIKREIKQQGGELTKKKSLESHNCYGDHYIDIDPKD